MNTAELKVLIQKNASEVSRLHARIHETLRSRGNGTRGHSKWQSACAEFHTRYNELAFPGGYEGAAARILVAEPLAVEAALCFLELRPYFFRSGYMYQDILRKVKRAPLQQSSQSALAKCWFAKRHGKRGGRSAMRPNPSIERRLKGCTFWTPLSSNVKAS